MKTTVLPKNSVNQYEYPERRRKKDWVTRSVSIIAAIGWVFAFVSLTLIDQAKPETENFFTRVFNLKIRGYWDFALLRVSLGVLIVSLITSIIGFFVNMSRHHRKTDRYNKAIIILGSITIILIFTTINKLM